ncbi:hypothetical protein N7451_008875 [Penicillium sp. IBT 35674x]|nr:hypothetical protein N7451_008875 [Penicillium sp. IBT 35674x]
MSSLQLSGLSEPFAILTDRLIVLPTPIAVSSVTYRKMYARLHADAGFCRMGFGSRFPLKNWNDSETKSFIETRDIDRNWKKYSLGDFAVGLRGSSQPDDKNARDKDAKQSRPRFSVLRGNELEEFTGLDMELLDDIHWVGYAGVRDASTTSMPAREAGDPALPPWQEMVELRYGVSPEGWGTGITKEAAEAVMGWAADERGVRRFIAETEKDNERSGRVLQKLGFSLSDTDYWKDPGEFEWELVVR